MIRRKQATEIIIKKPKNRGSNACISFKTYKYIGQKGVNFNKKAKKV